MAQDWFCDACGASVAWSEETCPACGEPLEWEEVDEDEPYGHTLPYEPYDLKDLSAGSKRWTRRYASYAVWLGLMGFFGGVALNSAELQMISGGVVIVAVLFFLTTVLLINEISESSPLRNNMSQEVRRAMAKDWSCYLCGEKVSWGTPVCPRCGSALDWEEEDEDDPYGHLLLYDDQSGGSIADRRAWIKRYAIGAIALGALVVVLGIADDVGGSVAWVTVLAGLVTVGVGIYGLVTLPNRYR